MTLHKRIVDNLNSTVLLLDPALRVEYLNPAGEDLFELSARKAVGGDLAALFRADDVLHDALVRAQADAHAFTGREMRLESRTGERLTVDMSLTPLGGGDRPYLLLEMVRVDRHLRIAREEQLLAQQSVTQSLLSGLAHEIKNPLGGLRGAAQLLERRLDDAGLREYTQVIIDEADRLQQLVDRMLGPTQLPRREAVNVHEVLERVRHLVSAEAGIAIETDYDPSLPMLVADCDQLIQALLNLVRNAVQATGPDGRVVLRSRAVRNLTIGPCRYRLAASIEVTDDGPGIEPEMLEKIFYPMVSDRPGGSGLGLAIAQSLIRRHRGLIECSSEPGRTTFRVLLPLEGDEDGK